MKSLAQREQVNNERMSSLYCEVSHGMYAVDAVKLERRWEVQVNIQH